MVHVKVVIRFLGVGFMQVHGVYLPQIHAKLVFQFVFVISRAKDVSYLKNNISFETVAWGCLLLYCRGVMQFSNCSM
jgi:hypothetical protein